MNDETNLDRRAPVPAAAALPVLLGALAVLASAACGPQPARTSGAVLGNDSPRMTGSTLPLSAAAGAGQSTPPPAAAGSASSGAAGSASSGAAGSGVSMPAANLPGAALPAAAGGAGNPPVVSRLPCAVSKALVTNCQACHGAQLVGGAPMHLTEYADFHKPAVTQAALQVHQLALMRLNDSAKPMPPASKITAPDKKTLADWLGAGAPAAGATEGSCEATAGTLSEVEDWGKGLTPRMGETCYEFSVHEMQTPGDTTPYVVKADEHYEQFYYKVPWPAGSVATRFGAKLDKVAVLHHWLLFTTAKDASNDGKHVTSSGSQLGDTAELLAGWAVGGDNLELDADMGLALPDQGMLNVQWHFYNTTGMAMSDASVVQVCIAPRASRQKILGMTWLGTEDLGGAVGMPAHAKSDYSGTCKNKTSAPIMLWAFWPHMHKLGRHLKSTIQRVDGTTEAVFDQAYDFNQQLHNKIKPEAVLQPGDKITSTCSFDNDTDRAVAFGPSTTEEMCYQFTYSYPAGALNNGVFSLIGASNTCWGD